MNKTLLNDLFSIYSPTNDEKEVSDFICNFLKNNNINYTVDSYGNIIKMDCKNKPLLSAHMDQVNYIGDIDKDLLKFIEIKNINNKEYVIGRGNLGADDKCGIFIILSYLTEVSKDINFILSVGEELTQARGIENVINNFMEDEIFKSIPYCLVLDRHEASDILCSENHYGTKEFEDDLYNIGKKYGFKPAKGIFCDANTLRYFMSCANISVGYYNAHTHSEFFCIDEMNNTYEYVKEIINSLSKKYGKPNLKSTYNKIKKIRRISDFLEKIKVSRKIIKKIVLRNDYY